MKDSNLTKKELDELAKRLVIAGSAAESDIDRIVSNPRLFDSVMARLAADPLPEARPSRTVWRPAAVLGFAVALVAATLGAYLAMTRPQEVAIAEKPKPASRPYEVTEKPFEPSRPYDPPAPSADDRPRAEPAVLRKPLERPEVRKDRPAQRPKPEQPEPAFHPIGFEERAEDAALDGRIVRVELPRSALFAMGVNVPLENGTRTIKADILVGADGSPRGIRLID